MNPVAEGVVRPYDPRVAGKWIAFVASGFGLALSVGAGLALAASAQAATIKVDTESDTAIAGECSLRDAVTAANDNQSVRGCRKGQASKRDTILMKIEGSHSLSIPSTDESLNLNGDLDISDGGPLTIRGARGSSGLPHPTGLVAPADDRAFDVLPGADLSVERLEIVPGSSEVEVAAGGLFRVNDAKLKLKQTEVQDGQAAVGGGIAAFASANVKIIRSIVTSNNALLGGALALQGDARASVSRSDFTFNGTVSDASAQLKGGAILSQGRSLKVLDSSFAGNLMRNEGSGSAEGGAIFSEANLSVKRSTFSDHQVVATDDAQEEEGGALYVDTGGGERPDAEIVNSTFYNNLTGAEGRGGAILQRGNWLISVAHTTFSDNGAGAGADLAGSSGIGGILLTASGLGLADSTDPCDGGIVSQGYNLFRTDDEDCDVEASDEVVPDIGFANTPDENGGPTETIALEPGSPAKDFVPNKECGDAEGVDQRGYERPAGKRCDAGAFERGAKP